MAIGPREVMRSEVDGGLSGPANPIPSQSLDCGCKQLPCPKLAKFATRRLFVFLLCWIGLVQAAAQAYLYISSPTIARRYKFHPILMEWVLIVAELTPFVMGFGVAYWGDRIHRAAWTGALALLQSATFLVLIIPHFTHSTRLIEEIDNVSHVSIYAEDNPEKCSSGSARLILENDEFCYTMLVVLIGVQILTGISNVAYYALGISYLDDNTKKRQVGALIGCVIGVKIIGLLAGYVLAWACLKLDSNNLEIVASYQEQIGAWWLGWPIIAFFLAIPAILVSWLPRRLPSEVVEQAAASILDLAGRTSPASIEVSESRRVGDTGFFSSLCRLFSNKILICNVLVAIFATTALTNFMNNENIILESRYHVPRPTGILLGFGDPLWSRLIANTLKPIVIGTMIIISGMVISKVRPRARSLTIYNVVVLVISATIIFSLAFATCEKPLIVGETKGSLDLLSYCNRNCHCSRDADFRPVCDSQGTRTFYSPCHAGCRSIESVDGVKIWGGCDCLASVPGSISTQANEGPCGSKSCQIGWLVFEVGTLVAYSLTASSIVGTLLMILRSVYLQDKALAISFWLTFVSFFVYLPGKFAYQKIADLSCKYWGRGSICHLHETDRLGDYMTYLTSFLLILAAAFAIVLWFFCEKLRLYGNASSELPRDTELREAPRNQVIPLLSENAASSNAADEVSPGNVEQIVVIEASSHDHQEPKVDEDTHQRSGQLKYGPLGPGDRRTNGTALSPRDNEVVVGSKPRRDETDDDLETSSDEEADKGRKRAILNSSPRIAYKPLELDSDVESDLSSVGPRSRRRVPSGVFDDLSRENLSNAAQPFGKRPFPNPDDYESPTRGRDQLGVKSLENLGGNSRQGGFSRTNSFEFATSQVGDVTKASRSHEGDFNEVGIPVMQPLVAASKMTSLADPGGKEVRVLMPRHQKAASQERLEKIRSLLDSAGSTNEKRRNRLGHSVLREAEHEEYPDVPPPIIGRPPSRGQASSGFGSLPDIGDTPLSLPAGHSRITSNQSSRTNSPKGDTVKGGPLATAL